MSVAMNSIRSVLLKSLAIFASSALKMPTVMEVFVMGDSAKRVTARPTPAVMIPINRFVTTDLMDVNVLNVGMTYIATGTSTDLYASMANVRFAMPLPIKDAMSTNQFVKTRGTKPLA